MIFSAVNYVHTAVSVLNPLWCQLNTLKVLQRSKVQTSKKQANGTNSRSLFFINNE